MLPWIEEAKKYYGIKHSPKEPSDKLQQWCLLLRDVEYKTGPWSGLFMAFVLSQVGIDHPKNPTDTSTWKNFVSVLKEPAYGCIVQFKTHVGIYLGEDDRYYFILGGNQSDHVKVSPIAKSGAVSYSWPLTDNKFLAPGRIKTTLEQAEKSL